jgi:hypothetical protein
MGITGGEGLTEVGFTCGGGSKINSDAGVAELEHQ